MTPKNFPAEPLHGDGLSHDLALIAAHQRQRRRTLGWLAACASGALLTAGCGGGEDEAEEAASGTGTGTGTGTSTGTGTDTQASCVADPAETAGPYPADGTNTSSGVTSDVLTASGIVRSDIRSSFLGTTTVAQGVQISLTLTVVNTNASCAALAGYAVYLWHCDQAGNYSLYSVPAESYLRGVQVTDSNGQVTFTTIVPGCYAGRYPHLHFEVFSSLASATTGRNAVLTSQLALPQDVCNTVYASVSGYSQSVRNLAQVSLATDNVFSDNTAAQNAAMTLTMAGSVATGYTATATIGLAL
jgi:protocatechuate 3,4-dioxygenase beta subunit